MSKKIITDVPKLITEYESGDSTVVLGERYGTSATVINKTLKRNGAKLRTLSDAHADVSGENNPFYKGKGFCGEDGVYLTPDANGYLRRISKGHPLADKTGLIGEHVYQACLKYGVDAVRGMDVHHKNRNKSNNNWNNLEIHPRSEHRRLENNF